MKKAVDSYRKEEYKACIEVFKEIINTGGSSQLNSEYLYKYADALLYEGTDLKTAVALCEKNIAQITTLKGSQPRLNGLERPLSQLYFLYVCQLPFGFDRFHQKYKI